jgi:hypothetical protein
MQVMNEDHQRGTVDASKEYEEQSVIIKITDEFVLLPSPFCHV